MDIVDVCKKSFFIILITFYLDSCSTRHKTIITPLIKKNDQIKIGFGSCLNQDKAMPIFDAIKKEELDLFLMLGDNVYGDSEEKYLKDLRLAYKTQRKNFEKMNLNFPFEAIWDDHDYGMNDAGVEYPHKKRSKELFLNFWNVPEDDIRRFREGLYFEIIEYIDNLKPFHYQPLGF